MNKQKVLLITADFTPKVGPGAERLTAFYKGLLNKGYEVKVLTSVNINGSLKWVDTDKSDLEHYASQNTRGKKQTDYQKLINFFVPFEPEVLLSFKSFRQAITTLFEEFIPDVIFTTSNPLATSVFGMFVKKKFDIKWIAEFRDPWTSNPLRRWPTYIHFRIEKYFEKNIFKNADSIVVNTKEAREQLLSINEFVGFSKVHVLSHSYDSTNKTFNDTLKGKNTITIGYAGGFYRSTKVSRLQSCFSYGNTKTSIYDSSPERLIKAVYELNKSQHKTKFKIKFIGTNPIEIADLIHAKTKEFITFKKRVPSSKIPHELSKVDLVFITNPLIKNSPFIGTKTFDYIALDKPIVAELEEGEQLRVIQSSGLGLPVKPRCVSDMKDTLMRLSGGIKIVKDMNYVDMFHRNEQVKELSQILKLTIDDSENTNYLISKGLAIIKNDN